MKKFYELLESLREARQISKKDLSRRTGLSAGYISLLTRGEREAPSENTLELLANALNLDAEMRSYFFGAAGYSPDAASSPSNCRIASMNGNKKQHNYTQCDWGEAPDIRAFYGRQQEITTLEQWIIEDGCRLVMIQGIGGVGKTALATMLAAQISDTFEYVFWRSLQSAPSLKSILEKCILFFSNQEVTDLPGNEDELILLLIKSFRDHCCLLVLDNFESVLQGGKRAGLYCEGCEGYGRLLQRMGESEHRSCVLLTAREKPGEISRLEGRALLVRSMELQGMKPAELQKILQEEGIFGSDDAWSEFIERYAGNPLALKLVSASIRELFGGDISWFLYEGDAVFGDLHDSLSQQFHRLSEQERRVIYCLAIERVSVSLNDLRTQIVPAISMRALQEALDSMRRRSMVESSQGRFWLIPVILEYITERIIEDAFQAVATESAGILISHALMRAQAKDYVRNSQVRLILDPLARRLLNTFDSLETDRKLRNLLTVQQNAAVQAPNYVAGNVLNLLVHLKTWQSKRPVLRRYDFSRLLVWEAYLQDVGIREVNFSDADLSHSTFTNTFGGILSLAISPDSKLIAAGTANGEVRLWQSSCATPYITCKGHADWVGSVAFSPDGRIHASGSDDHTVRLWEVSTGECLHVLEGHDGWIKSVAFSSDGKLLASGSEDRTICVWSISTRELIRTLHGHTGQVQSIAFSPDGDLLASGGEDHVIRVWNTTSWNCVKTLQGLRSRIYAVAFSPDRQVLVSGSADQTVNLWETQTWESLKTLQGYSNRIYSVAFSPNGQYLASGSDDQAIRLWEVHTGKLLRTLIGHSNRVWSVAFSPDGRLLASGGNDQAIRLWDVKSGKTLAVLQGHMNWVRSVAFSPDGRLLASGSEDQTIRLWDINTRNCLLILQSHQDRVYSVAFSPDSAHIASGSKDQIIRLWEAKHGICLATLSGHHD